MTSGVKTILTLLLFITQLVAAGCVGHLQAAAVPPDVQVWPTGDLPPRIRFVSSFSTPEELQIRRGLLLRIWDFVAGSSDRRLVNPHGLTVDADGTIYVVDTALKGVQIFNRKEGSFSSASDEELQLQTPINPEVDAEQKLLYLTDAAAGLVRVLSLAEGGRAREFGRGQLERPTGIVLNRFTDELLVVDTRKAAVFRYHRYDLTLKGRFGERGSGPGQFNHPTDLAVNRAGEIVVSDALNFRVQIFSPDGRFLRSFGKAGDSPGYFNRPKGVAVDSDNNIYVVDTLFDNVQIFDIQGRLLLSFGSAGQGPGEFWMPSGIHIDRDDRIYVADTYNKRVQIFQYLRQAGSK